MNAYREPGEVDKTVVETARLHEEAETRRRLITEREETKRKRIEKAGDAPWVIRGLFMGVLAIGIIAGSLLAGSYFSDRKPVVAVHCHESVDIVGASSTPLACEPGATMTTEPGPGADRITVRCRCVAWPTSSSDAVAEKPGH